ncbi:hypothetical protein ABH920_009279 [Catenulispora sp. EB89]|uniref:hypothetical protein n=1 Tax=Catenulispora sp. EB89 TaxID=3156257 RepID=UPI003513FE93
MSIFRRAKPTAVASPAEPFDATRYGMVDYRDVAVNESLGDVALAGAAYAARCGDWKPAAEALAGTGTDWDRRMLRVAVLSTVSLQTDAWLESWLSAEPDSPHAAAVHAASLMGQAGRARGTARAKATSREQFEGFFKLARQSDEEALRAIDLSPEDPTPWVFRMQAALGRQIPNDEFTVLWNEAFARAPMHRRAHSYAHTYWLAKWFGSEEWSAQFVEDAVARAPRTALAFELKIHRLQEAWLTVRDATPSPGSAADFYRGAGRPLLDEALGQWDGTMPTGGALEIVDRNLLAWALTMAERYDEACDVFQAVGADVCMGYPWLYYRDPRRGFGSVRKEAIENSSRQPTR